MVGPSDQCRRSAFSSFGSSCQEKTFLRWIRTPGNATLFSLFSFSARVLRSPAKRIMEIAQTSPSHAMQKHATVKMEFVDNTPTGLAETWPELAAEGTAFGLTSRENYYHIANIKNGDSR